jgi:hypothetical protein
MARVEKTIPLELVYPERVSVKGQVARTSPVQMTVALYKERCRFGEDKTSSFRHSRPEVESRRLVTRRREVEPP